MIHEVAKLVVTVEKSEAFEVAVAAAAPLFERADGCHHMSLHRITEEAGAYHLIVAWESIAHHTDMFRNSPDFEKWRALVGGFFLSPPVVIHTAVSADFF
jgi:quinol monooxygenase YgiN